MQREITVEDSLIFDVTSRSN